MRRKKLVIRIKQEAGAFAENKETATTLRDRRIRPALEKGDAVVLDFSGVDGATQSFVHVLIREALDLHGEEILSRLEFKGCTEGIKSIVLTVIEYSLTPAEKL